MSSLSHASALEVTVSTITATLSMAMTWLLLRSVPGRLALHTLERHEKPGDELQAAHMAVPQVKHPLALDEVFDRAGAFGHGLAMTLPEGRQKPVVSEGQLQLDGWGKPKSVFGVVTDSTEDRVGDSGREANQSRLTTALTTAERNEARYRLLADNVTDVVASLGPDLKWTFVSPASTHVAGYQLDEFMARPLQSLVLETDWPNLQNWLEGIRAGHVQGNMQFRLTRIDGAVIHIEATGRLLPDGASIILCMRDVTSRRQAEQELFEINATLRQMVRTDPLTGLANRRCLDEFLATELKRCMRHGLPISLILSDIDLFKSYNDEHGHPAGDACLRAVAQTIGGFARRPEDLAARYGGEEFAVILPGLNSHHAKMLGEKIRAAVANLKISSTDSPTGYITASFGVATFNAPTRADTALALLVSADEQLYKAKERGRNLVVCKETQAA